MRVRVCLHTPVPVGVCGRVRACAGFHLEKQLLGSFGWYDHGMLRLH